MNELDTIANWAAERRRKAPAPEASFGDDVMARVREAAAAPAFSEKVAATVRGLVPARRERFVFLGGSAIAGALRVIVILYLVLGVC